MAILQKCRGTISSKTSAISLTLIFWEFILNFQVRCVSLKFTTLFMSPAIPNMITGVVYLIINVVLEEYSNSLPNNN